MANSVIPVSAAAVISFVVGVTLVSKPSLVLGIGALALTAIGVAVAFTRPAVAFVGLIAMTAFLPSYAAPAVGPLLFIPAAAACWVLALVLGWRNLVLNGRVFRPTVIDLGVGAFVLLMAISIAFSPRTSRDEYLHLMFLWAGPYLGVRLLLADVRNPLKLAAIAFGIATAILAPIALFEYLGGSNPFHALNFNSAEYAVWAEQASRFGAVRAAASFGHPIALSMFAATSTIFSLAAALTTKRRWERNLWYGSAGLATIIQVFTVSRTGWLMLFVGVVGLILIFSRGDSRRRLVALIVGLGAAVLLTSQVAPTALEAVPGFEKSETRVDNSSRYRQALLSRALEPGVLNLWGNQQNEVTPYVSGSTATDNAYIILADTWGLIPTAALFFLALALLAIIARAYGRDATGLVALPIAGLASLVALFVVAFITQQQVVIWMVLGASGVATERFAVARREPRPIQPSVGLERM